MADEIRWEAPTPAAREGSAPAPLQPDQVASWRERGFVLVDDLLAPALLERARDDALALFPAPGSPESENVRDFGSGGRLQFPSTSDAAWYTSGTGLFAATSVVPRKFRGGRPCTGPTYQINR